MVGSCWAARTCSTSFVLSHAASETGGRAPSPWARTSPSALNPCRCASATWRDPAPLPSGSSA
eukprot:4578684-Prymnesium_polylepis.1